MRRKQRPAPNKPFDATTKALTETNPRAWTNFLGLPGTDVELVSADLSTITTEADVIVLVKGPYVYALHHEYQAGPDKKLPVRCLRYNVLTGERLEVPVHTLVILLRREADAYKNITGVHQSFDGRGEVSLTFRYDVVRLWETPVEAILKADPALLPYALLCDLSGTTPQEVVGHIDERLKADVPNETTPLLWTATYILAGLTYPPEAIESLLAGVANMKESATYQKILAEGEAVGIAKGAAREAQNMLLLVGEGRLGTATPDTVRRIRAINSVQELEGMGRRLLAVESWDDLLK